MFTFIPPSPEVKSACTRLQAGCHPSTSPAVAGVAELRTFTSEISNNPDEPSVLYSCSELFFFFFLPGFCNPFFLKSIPFCIFSSSKFSQTMSHRLFAAFVKILY